MISIFCGMEKLSLVDFDGHLSCTLFTSGCNFHCEYCHNSPLMKHQDGLDFDDILDFLKKRKGILDAVVISGGEPTLMKDLKQYISDIKSLGYIIKLDTNGTNPQMVKELVEEHLIDYVAMDIKNSLANYPKTVCTNVDLDKVQETINYLINGKIDYEFRTTLVKEYHTKEDIIDISNLIKGAKRYYLQLFNIRETVLNQSLHEVEKEVAEEYRKILQSTINQVELRGYK